MRAEGYYWVKCTPADNWMIAYYHQGLEFDWVLVTAQSKKPTINCVTNESDLFEVNENQIIPL